VRREIDRSRWGRKQPGRIRRALGLYRETWHDRHPLPAGWRPRTRIDCYGREVEPWSWIASDPYGSAYDAGEWWLPVGYDPDQAAWEILQHWLTFSTEGLEPHELPGMRISARRAAWDGGRVGIAHASEAALSAS
jgi:hypothetical protein